MSSCCLCGLKVEAGICCLSSCLLLISSGNSSSRAWELLESVASFEAVLGSSAACTHSGSSRAAAAQAHLLQAPCKGFSGSQLFRGRSLQGFNHVQRVLCTRSQNQLCSRTWLGWVLWLLGEFPLLDSLGREMLHTCRQLRGWSWSLSPSCLPSRHRVCQPSCSQSLLYQWTWAKLPSV